MPRTSKKTLKRTSNKPVKERLSWEDTTGGSIYWKRMNALQKADSKFYGKEIPNTTGTSLLNDLNLFGFSVTFPDKPDYDYKHLKVVIADGVRIFEIEETLTHTYLVDYSLPVAPGDRIAILKHDGSGTMGYFKRYVEPKGMKPTIIMDNVTYSIDEIASIGKVTGYFAYHPFTEGTKK